MSSLARRLDCRPDVGFPSPCWSADRYRVRGHYAMAVPNEITFWIGLLLIALGTGLLKERSAMVGELYHDHDTKRDAGFSVFYMASTRLSSRRWSPDS